MGNLKNELPCRKNIVLSRGNTSCSNQLYSIDEVHQYFFNNEGWITGGTMAENFYTTGTLLYLTHVHINVHNGTFLNLPTNIKTLWRSQTFLQNGYNYTFTINIIL